MSGKAWKFGDDVSTDLITPGRYFHLRSNLPELAKHVLEDARSDFPKKVKAGDFVVGGKNFGCGSSREHAALVIKMAGVAAVCAKSFARIFYRNAINVGLAVLECDTATIDGGDELDVDLEQGLVINLTKNTKLETQTLPKVMRAILADDGLISHIKKRGGLRLD